ncbi:lysylphosphatidylglycerol synthase transmembrane domain-containing protein [Rhodopirellula sp. JC639]|uniref:lysylphosphatidylglycerol synthase transmembrane domain-containing protein n=1 Tax=Stieleria mannarensis TaxID=2755585 RepID=UPI001601507A|nr:lysylphosphatidylglycerol synthase transmembrane domain-containing protein [Rhodopirellula sp. JC639]
MDVLDTPGARATVQTNTRFWISISTTAVFGIIGAVWVRNQWTTMVNVLDFHPIFIAGMIVMSLLHLGVMSRMNQLATSHLGTHLAMARWLAVTVAGTFVNLVMPFRAGLPLRAAYLKKFANLSVSHFASVLGGITLISIAVTSTIGLAAIPWTGMAIGTAADSVRWLLTLLLLASLAVMVIPADRPFAVFTLRWGSAVQMVCRGWDEIRRSKLLLLRIAFGNFLQILFTAGRLFFAYHAIGQDCSAPDAVLLAVLASVSTLVSITPSGLGVREAVLSAAEAASGGDASIGLMAALADRVVSTFVVFAISPFAFAIIVADMRRSTEPGKTAS